MYAENFSLSRSLFLNFPWQNYELDSGQKYNGYVFRIYLKNIL